MAKNVKRVAKSAARKLKQGVRNLPPGTFQKVGRKAGNLVGLGPLGGRVGSALAALTGHGDYSIVQNSLMGRGRSSPAGLLFDKRGRRGVRFVRREFIGNITGSVAFTNRSYPINPGLASSMPWFSNIAINYDEWVPNGVVYEFKSFLADFNGTSATLGSCIGACEYDSLDPAYSTKVEMEASVGAASLRGNQDAIFGVECAPSERVSHTLYTRSGSVPTGGTIAHYDLGTFQFATSNFSNDTDIIGELWINYDVTLFKEQLMGGQVGNNLLLVNLQNSTSVSAAGPLGSSTTITQYGTLPVGITTASGADPDIITLPSYIGTGSYRFILQWTGDVAAAVVFPTLTPTNMTLITSDGAPSLDYGNLLYPGSGNSACAILDRTFTVTAPGASLSIGVAGTIPTTNPVFSAVIFQVPTTSPQVYIGAGTQPS